MPSFCRKEGESHGNFHPTPHRIVLLKLFRYLLGPEHRKTSSVFPPSANIQVGNPYRLSTEVTALERKRSACQYNTGQDWNRGWGIGLAMQSMSVKYLTKLSPGHFAVWFHQSTASLTVTSLRCMQPSQAFSRLPTAKQRWTQQRAAATQPSESTLKQEMQGKKKKKAREKTLVTDGIKRESGEKNRRTHLTIFSPTFSLQTPKHGGERCCCDCMPNLLQPPG